MMLDFLGQPQAASSIEAAVADLLRSQRLKGVGTGVHRTNEVGDLVVGELRAVAARV